MAFVAGFILVVGIFLCGVFLGMKFAFDVCEIAHQDVNNNQEDA